MSLSKAQLRQLRETSDEYHRVMRAGLPADQGEHLHVAELVNLLACSVEYLLDEIERLQAREAAALRAIRIVKADIRGGQA